MAIDVGSNLDFQGVLTAKNLLNPPVDSGDAVPLGYLSTELSGLLQNPQALDASTDPVDFPTSTAIGETFYISDTGTVGGVAVTEGDLLIAIGVGNAAADYLVIQSTNAASSPATETVAGVVELATEAEVLAGTDSTRVVTPLTLTSALEQLHVVDTIDASTDPNYPAATEGDIIEVTVAGLIGGASGLSVDAGDLLIAVADSAGGTQATAGSEFRIIQGKLDLATETVPGIIELATAAEAAAGTDTEKAITAATLSSVLTATSIQKYTEANIGDASATSFTVTHNLDTLDISKVSVIDNTTGLEWMVCVTVTDADNIQIDFDLTPTLNQFRVVVLG